MLICTSQRAFLLSSGIAVQNVTLWCVSFYHHVTCLALLLRKYTTLRLLLKSKRMTVISFVNRYHFWKLLPITFELVASASRNMYFSAPVKVLPYPYSSGVWWKVRPVNQIDACIPTSDIEYHHTAYDGIVTDMLDLTHEWVSRVTRWWNRFKLFFLLPSRWSFGLMSRRNILLSSMPPPTWSLSR